MSRLLLRLLLIVSLVMNGIGAPWAMAKAPVDDHDHSRMMAQAVADVAPAMTDCHGGARSEAAGLAANPDRGDSPPPIERSCCDGPQCSCGCVLPPLLIRFMPSLSALHWTAAPIAEPTMRAVARATVPPFRPPSA